MKIYRICLLVFCINSLMFSQTFTVEWEFETTNRAMYVGDIDGDGVGEFVDNSPLQADVIFFDAETHQVKYTVTDKGEIEEISIDLISYNNSFPHIDYNNNGVSDFIFVDLLLPQQPVYRIIDPSTSTIIFEFPPAMNRVYQFGWLGDFDNDGILELSVSYYLGTGNTKNIIYSTGIIISTLPDGEKYLPANFHLSQNYPNPFNPSTIINYSVKEPGMIKLIIYNELGEKVRVLVNEWKPAGNYKFEFNAGDLASGIYYYQIKIGNEFAETKKMVLLK